MKNCYSLCGITCIVRGLDCMEYPFSCSFSYTNAFYNIFAPGTIGEMGLHYTKLEEMARSAVILRISIAKHHVAAGTYSPSTTNEKRKTYAQRDFLKCEQFQPEHKAPKRYVEVAINDLHRNTADYIPVNRGSQSAPPQRIPPG